MNIRVMGLSLLLCPLMVQAKSLSCQHFAYDSPEVQAERAVASDAQPSSSHENHLLPSASLLAEKTVCMVSGNLAEAYAAFRSDKQVGLGKHAAVFPHKLPALPYQKTYDWQHDGWRQSETWQIQQHGKQLIWSIVILDDASAYHSVITFTPVGTQVRVERRVYAS